MSCSLVRIRPTVAGNSLKAVITTEHLGFKPQKIWNPSPSTEHRITPYPLPRSLAIGIAGNKDTNAKFSPPPYAVVLEARGHKALVVAIAKPGWHRWNEAVFAASSRGVQVELDRSGEEKKATQLDDILGLFNAISIECGN